MSNNYTLLSQIVYYNPRRGHNHTPILTPLYAKTRCRDTVTQSCQEAAEKHECGIPRNTDTRNGWAASASAARTQSVPIGCGSDSAVECPRATAATGNHTRVTGTGTRRSLSRQASSPQKHPQPWRSRTAPKNGHDRLPLCGCSLRLPATHFFVPACRACPRAKRCHCRGESLRRLCAHCPPGARAMCHSAHPRARRRDLLGCPGLAETGVAAALPWAARA